MEVLLLLVACIFLSIGIFLGIKYALLKTKHEWEGKIPSIREDAIKRSRSVLSGQFSEQLAPYLPEFPYSPTEVRFIGKPIDFLVFKGMDEKAISEVVFVEVKSGRSTMNSQEKALKEAILAKRVRWEEYRVP
jgi:predicted Holliday junction resolvase-like endonuclease